MKVTVESALSNSEQPVSLQRDISAFGAWMLGVSGLIGSMAWLIHSSMLARGGPLASTIAWVIAGLMSFPTALVLMELSSMFPHAGGPYVYKYYALRRLIPGAGECVGFLTGWLFWAANMVGIAFMANGLSNMLCETIYGSVSASPIWYGPVVILILFAATTLLNCLSVKEASRFNALLTLTKFGMVAGFVTLVAVCGRFSLSSVIRTESYSGGANLGSNVSAVLMLALFGFSFLELTGCISGETEDAGRSVPRAMLRTLLTAAGIYVVLSVAVSGAVPLTLGIDGAHAVISGTQLAASCPSITGFLAGSFWGQVFSLFVILSIASCSFTALMGTARVTYSMALTKLFPAAFAQLHPTRKVPVYALRFQFFALAIIGIAANLAARTGLCGDAYAFLGEVCGCMYAIVVTLYGICVVSLRYTDPDMARGFRIGGARGNFWVWPVAACSVGVWSYAAFACVSWTTQLWALGIFLCGLPIYFYYRR